VVVTDSADPAPSPPRAASAPLPPAFTTPATEETPLEFHKPKPVHSWRDFAKELGTIVLGIMIAIGLEQIVESWNWANEVKAARRAIYAEITANNVNVFAFRVAIAPCVDQQIDEADHILSALEAGRAPQKFSHFGRPGIAFIRDGEWEAERASQVLTHLPRSELALMSRYYAQLPDFRGFGNEEINAWRQLSSLQDPPKGLTASDMIRLRAQLSAVQDNESLIFNNSERLLRVSKQLGIPQSTPDPVHVRNWCNMNTEDFRRYRRLQDFR
jgi:hypothetical protein